MKGFHRIRKPLPPAKVPARMLRPGSLAYVDPHDVAVVVLAQTRDGPLVEHRPSGKRWIVPRETQVESLNEL